MVMTREEQAAFNQAVVRVNRELEVAIAAVKRAEGHYGGRGLAPGRLKLELVRKMLENEIDGPWR